MWVVFKYKSNEYNLLKKNLEKKTNSNIKFYNPKIKFSKLIKNKQQEHEKHILENYAFCYLENFKEKIYINRLKNTRGLGYFLSGYIEQQNDIKNFINLCISNHKGDGTLAPSFFLQLDSKKAKFIGGPFSNMVFEILGKQKNKLKILLGGIVTTIENNSNILYRPV